MFTTCYIQIKQFILSYFARYFLLLCCLLLVTSCTNQRIIALKLPLAGNAYYLLQPIPASLNNRGLQATFTISHQNKEQELLVQAEFNQSRMVVSGMTLEGLTLFTISWQDSSNIIDFESKIDIEPLRMLAEMQFSLWPIADVANGLKNALIKELSGNTKEISVNDVILYQLSQDNNLTHIINNQQHYQLIINELARWKI